MFPFTYLTEHVFVSLQIIVSFLPGEFGGTSSESVSYRDAQIRDGSNTERPQ